MNPNIDEKSNYLKDVQSFEALYLSTTKYQTPKKIIIEKLTQFYNKYSNPEYKSHFLFLLAVVFDGLGKKEDAYRILIKAEASFPGTAFGRACGDAGKNMFVELSGRVEQIPPFPVSIQVEPTNYCNIDCVMCARSKKRSSGHMSMDVFKRIADESLTAGTIRICLYNMGEPLLNPNIVQFVAYFKERVRGFKFDSPCLPREIHIQTNGTTLNRDLSDGLMKAGLDHLSLSIDGATPEKFEEIRRGANFTKVINNLDKAGAIRDANKYPTRISVSVLDLGLDMNRDGVRLDKFYREKGADTVYFTPCSDAGVFGTINEGMSLSGNDGKMESEEKTEKSVSVPDSTSPGKTADVLLPRIILDRMTVLWNGDIQYTCGEPNNVIGNIETLSLTDAYQIKMRSLGFDLG